MSENKLVTFTVKELIRLFKEWIDEGGITPDTEVWLSSDEEGNEYSPLVTIHYPGGEKMINLGAEKDKSRVTLYPIS